MCIRVYTYISMYCPLGAFIRGLCTGVKSSMPLLHFSFQKPPFLLQATSASLDSLLCRLLLGVGLAGRGWTCCCCVGREPRTGQACR